VRCDIVQKAGVQQIVVGKRQTFLPTVSAESGWHFQNREVRNIGGGVSVTDDLIDLCSARAVDIPVLQGASVKKTMSHWRK
jgi:hypothetical protein